MKSTVVVVAVAVVVTGCGAAKLVPSQTTVDFGTLANVLTSPPTTVLFKNSGNAATPALRVELDAASSFVIDGDSCTGRSVAPGSWCAVTVSMETGVVGDVRGRLSVYGPSVAADVALAGTNAPATLSVELITPADVSVYQGDYTAGWGFTVTNVGGSSTGPITLTGVDPYTNDGPCIGHPLYASEGCLVHLTRQQPVDLDMPAGEEVKTAVFRSDPGGSASYDLRLHIEQSATLQVGDVAFGPVSPTNAVRTVTITNPGPNTTDPLTLMLLPDATNPAQTTPAFYAIAGDCDGQLAPGASCTVTLFANLLVAADYGLTVAVSAMNAHGAMARVTATGPRNYYDVRVGVGGNGAGTITVAGNVVEPGAWVAFANGTSATFQATPAAGSVFVGWTSACNSTATTCTVTPADNADLTLNAGFQPSP